MTENCIFLIEIYDDIIIKFHGGSTYLPKKSQFQFCLWSFDMKRLIQKFRGNTYFWVNIRDSLLLCVCTHAHQSSTALDSQYRLTYTHIEYILVYQLYIHMHLRCCRNNLFWTMNQRTGPMQNDVPMFPEANNKTNILFVLDIVIHRYSYETIHITHASWLGSVVLLTIMSCQTITSSLNLYDLLAYVSCCQYIRLCCIGLLWCIMHNILNRMHSIQMWHDFGLNFRIT